MLRDDRLIEPLEHVVDLLAVHPAIENDNLMSWESAVELFRQAAGIGGCGGARPRAVSRRGAKRHDLDRLAVRKLARRMGERKIKSRLLRGNRTRRRRRT